MLLIATVSGMLLVFFLAVSVVPWIVRHTRHAATAPDGPEPFGTGTAWLAVHTADIDRIIAILGLGEIALSNWQNGLAIVEDPDYCDTYVFVTPPVDGWTFVVGLGLPYPAGRGYRDRCLPLLLALGRAFSDVQYFYACPMLDIFAWSRFSGARLRRSFAWGDEGMVWNKGAVTAAERQLGLRVFTSGETGQSLVPADIDEDESGYPNVQHVLRMAGAWSLNPETFDRLPEDPAQGYIGRMPDTWRVLREEGRAAIVEPLSP